MSRGSIARLCLLALVWGASFLFIKVALEGLSPLQIVVARLALASATLGLILAVRGQGLPREPVVWGHLAAMGVVANLVPFFLFAWGEQRITSGLAGVLNGSTPLFTLGIAVAALDEERLTPTRGVGLLTGFAGVVLVVGPWDQNPLTSSIPGQLACLAAAACYGVAFVYTRRFLTPRGYPPLALAAGQLGVATVLGLLLAPAWVGPVELTLPVVASIGTLGALGTGLAYLLYYRLVRDAGATSASMVTYLIPVVAVVLGVLVLGEPVGWNLFAGAAVVILGVALAEGRLDRISPLGPARPAQARPVAAPPPGGESVDAPPTAPRAGGDAPSGRP